MSKFELLAPAGDLEKLKVAILYGANAVFIGGLKFSLRSRASNFTLEDIKEGCEFAHAHNAKIHVTCNIVMHEHDTDDVIEYLKALEACGVDAIIASSLYILKMVLEHTHMEAHVSTQQSSANSETIDFFTKFGVHRVVLARELDLDEIKEVVKNSKVDIEAFIHGGMCVSYSGRCMLSNNMTNRDANRGGCAHSCRWNYDLIKDGKVYNKEGDYFAMSSKDLCAIKAIPKLMDSGVYSFKIEGRMKSLHYIATVVNAYRRIIDEYETTGKVLDYDSYITAIEKAENRLTGTGFLFGDPTVDCQLYDLNLTVPTKDFIGIVRGYDKETKIAYIEQRNYFLPNTTIEVFSPRGTFNLDIKEIYDEDGNSLDAARHPLQKIHFKSDIPLSEFDLLRLI
ncbi:putative protease [Anaeroplasma bactoclasticum]|jgi:putative protease|uniref:Putative protease n=1 Tax=Anaeroplasma bactoclasticum TaxID=2088 RepID=A0A397S231_9MOLU|nr:U32 family peptidase [Anaeroplasma bactoclasticum]RIA78007.1 putative protease [Anaeroplasma bactoclasticum]